MEDGDNMTSDGITLVLILIGALGAGLIAVLGFLGKKKRGGPEDRGPKDYDRRWEKHPPGPGPWADDGAHHGGRQRPPEQQTGAPVVCLVVPAFHAELVAELRQAEATGTLEQRQAELLKGAALRFWYGRTGNRREFEPLLRIAEGEHPTSTNQSLDFVLCLFYLRSPDDDFEAGTIGRTYDGILSLPGNVLDMKLSPQVSADSLSGLRLTAI